MLETVDQLVDQDADLFKAGVLIGRWLEVLDFCVLKRVDNAWFPEYVSNI
jgi:hypothetical protein